MAFLYGALRSHSVRHTKLSRASLDKWWARHRDLYLTTHAITETNIHTLVGFRTCNPSKREAARPRLRSLRHGDRPFVKILCLKSLHLAARKLKRLLCSDERCICHTRTLRETELFLGSISSTHAKNISLCLPTSKLYLSDTLSKKVCFCFGEELHLPINPRKIWHVIIKDN